VSTLIPNYLGDDESILVGGPDDPIANFGHEASAYLMREVMKLPPAARKPALKSLFDQLDPNLWSLVARKSTKLARERDMGPMEALEKAIAASVSIGLLRETIAIGRTGRRPKLKSLSGLGAYGETAELVVLSGYMDSMQALGWCGPVCQAKKAGRSVKRAAVTTTRKVGSGARWIGSKTASGARSTWEFGKKAAKKFADLSCKVYSSGVAEVAASAGAAAVGAPPEAGKAGVEIQRALYCRGGKGEEEAAELLLQEQARTKKFPTLLIAAGGVAALGIVFLATRRK
jgi:hypothetical protein